MPSPRPVLGSTYDPITDEIGVWAAPDAAYAQALEEAAPGITAMIPQQQVQGESWMDTLARSLPIIAATYQQKQILDVQMERARQGLPPLQANQYAAGVQVGLAPDLMKYLLIGGAVLVGFMVLKK